MDAQALLHLALGTALVDPVEVPCRASPGRSSGSAVAAMASSRVDPLDAQAQLASSRVDVDADIDPAEADGRGRRG